MPTRQRAHGVASTLHRVVYQGTGGRLGHHRSDGADVLLLTTTSPDGRPRTTLLPYVRDCESWLVVPTGDRPPAWFRDVGDGPHVVTQVGSRRFAATAVIVDGPAREALWWTVTRRYPELVTPCGGAVTRPPVVVLRARSRDRADVPPAGLLLGT